MVLYFMVREAFIFLEHFPKTAWLSLVPKMFKGQSECEGGTNSSGSVFEDLWTNGLSTHHLRTGEHSLMNWGRSPYKKVEIS